MGSTSTLEIAVDDTPQGQQRVSAGQPRPFFAAGTEDATHRIVQIYPQMVLLQGEHEGSRHGHWSRGDEGRGSLRMRWRRDEREKWTLQEVSKQCGVAASLTKALSSC